MEDRQEPTPANLEKLIEVIVDMKMRDHQLDDCNLTMRELTRIKEALRGVLVGIYHRRPQYPKDPTDPSGEGQFMPEFESGRLPGSPAPVEPRRESASE